MPTVSEEKNAHYRVIEQRVIMARTLEHLITSEEFKDCIQHIYQIDPYYSSTEIGSDDILQEIKTGVTICIEQLKDQVKGYLV